MRRNKHWLAPFLAALLFCAVNITAYALETPDLTRRGSVSVTMEYGGEAVPGGTLTLYQVGEIREDNGDYGFVLTGAFQGSGVSLDDLSSASLASELAEYVSDNGLAGTAVEISDDGTAAADGLTPGLYLIVQTEPAAGYEAAAPFLVSVPLCEDGTCVYDVDASPKVGLTASTVPGGPSEPGTTPEEGPGGSNLPQTGQLNWPVPVLAVLGLCLFLGGWALRFGKREGPYGA